MFCPECEAEYREGIETCHDCGAGLVEALSEVEHPTEPLVSVFRSADASLLPIAKSVLRGAGIAFLVQGDEAQGLYPFGPGGNLLGAHVLVSEHQADTARTLLEELSSSETGRGSGEEE